MRRDVRREFCTLFDTNYLAKALAMYRSLERHCPSFRLTAFCFDDEASRLLGRIGLPALEVVSLAELESADPELAGVKGDRTAVEYMWTATPALPRFLFASRPELAEITYLDADLFFFADPAPLFDEMGDASVLITPHRYPSRYRVYEINGKYNVQFMTFRRDSDGLECLEWWHARCIEWCYFRLEDGKLGDQKYLDDWPERFEGVHVLEHKGGGAAPWNISRYHVARGPDGTVMIDEDQLIFFHFHGFTLRADGRHDWRPPGYAVPAEARRLIYEPYFEALDAALVDIQAVAPGFSAGIDPPISLRDRFRRAAVGIGMAAERARFAVSARRPPDSAQTGH